MISLQLITVTFFIYCISLSIGKHHHHRFQYGLLHNKKGLNMGENMKITHGNHSTSEREWGEIAKKKDDITEVEKGSKKDEVDNALGKIKTELQEVLKNTAKAPEKSLMTQALATNFDEPLKNMKFITGGVATAFPALETLAEGIRGGDRFLIATSALTIASAVAVATGGPIGAVIATVLNFAVVMIKIFKPVAAEETQDEMLERVISESLREFRQQNLMASFSGFSKKFEMLESNLRTVERFLAFEMKDIGTEGGMQQFVTQDASGKKVTSKSEQQLRLSKLKYAMANEIMPLANEVMYDGVTTLGKIKFEIDTVCDLDSTLTEDTKMESRARKCLKMLELYSQMSFQRRFTYISQLVITLQKIIESTEVDDITKAKALAHQRLVGDNLKVTEEQDIKVLEFLVKPVYSFRRRYIINYYYTYLEEFKYLRTYVTSLPIKSEHGLLVCSKESLLGSCIELSLNGVTESGKGRSGKDKTGKDKTGKDKTGKDKTGKDKTGKDESGKDESGKDEGNSFDFGKGTFKPMSLLVPPGFTVKVKYDNLNYNLAKPLTIYGATTSSCLYYSERKETPPVTMVVSITTKSERKSTRIQMCRLNNKPSSKESIQIFTPPHKAVCMTILTDGFTEDTFAGSAANDESEKWKNTYKGFDIPKNHAVIGKAVHGSRNFYWGPFYGPRSLPKACGSVLWSTVITVNYTDATQLTKFARSVEILCNVDQTLEICKLDQVQPSTEFLEICKGEALNGYCDTIPINLVSGEQIINLDYLHIFAEEKSKIVDFSTFESTFTLANEITQIQFKSDYDDCIWKPEIIKGGIPKNILKSLKIPSGLKVELWTDKEGKGSLYGTYIGPADIGNADGNNDKTSLINSLKITKNLNGQ